MDKHNFLHVYRHLLRHTHSLYDDAARDYFSNYFRKRFRASVRDKAPPYRQRQRLKGARVWLSTIQRANIGVYKPLMRVLEHTYGRRGPRRHQLLKSQVPDLIDPPDGRPPPLFDISPLSEKSSAKNPVYLGPLPMSGQLTALLKWAEARRIHPDIPKTNKWGRPFPACRERNMRMRHVGKILRKCPAPLPFDEYGRLERLASGQEKPVPPRRRIIISNPSTVLKVHERPRDMTSRSLKRKWQSILSSTPFLRFDETKNKWEATQSSFIIEKNTAPLAELEDFEDFSPPPEKPSKKHKDITVP